ncbi:Mor transcription activator family protein [Acidovorax sp. SUPP3334]|uniref:Mor transcription activator family protein n=1 Tax=Acidovorax sp. SUPP3334 TaxID=2920881 RepID=UPI0023DE2433|nr:Mor transcription activator family protein [Acidovorax sp. SUPP3334]GKT21712.1 DNA-binding protein [Acidovorax sp. SUPP3334]
MSQESRMSERRNELLEDLVRLVSHLLLEYGLPEVAASLVAHALADHVADHWGGQLISFPKDQRRKLCLLEIEIYRQFTGGNYGELALKYGMGERGMRKLLSRVKARLAKQSNDDQMQLPV